MNPLVLWTSESFHSPQQNHFISVPNYHKTYQLWTIRYESYDIDRKQNFNVTFRNPIISIAPYQDSSIACVLYNLFVYLALVILVLAAVAITVLILLCAVTIYSLLVAVRQNWSQMIPVKRKNDENKESTESSESTRSLDKCYFHLCSELSIFLPTLYSNKFSVVHEIMVIWNSFLFGFVVGRFFPVWINKDFLYGTLKV